MSTPAATHIIEIETGIGEPTFIPLSVGQELQPISLGRQGMWRIESAGVLDVHAFMYFDGTALFLQSAEEGAAASVDGEPVGKSWTELHAPCKIDLGTARLRFRDLALEAREAAEREVQRREQERRDAERREIERREQERRDAERREQERIEAERREIERREQERRDAERREIERREQERRDAERRDQERRDAERREIEAREQERRDQERRDQERRDQERRDAERRHRAQTGPPPEAGYGYREPMPDFGATKHEHGGRRAAGGATGPPQPWTSRTADTGLDPMLAASAQGGYDTGSRMSPHHPYPTGPVLPSSSAPYNSAPPGYGSMTGGHLGGSQGFFGTYVTRYQHLSAPKRVLVVLAPFCLIAAAYLVLFDAPAGPTASADAGEPAYVTTPGVPGVPVQAAPPQPMQPQLPQLPQPQLALPQQPAQQPMLPQPLPVTPPPPVQPPPQPAVQLVCPPGYVLYTVPVPPNNVIPCVPIGTPMPPPTVAAAEPIDAGPPKTLERQAVDFVAASDYAHAAIAYEMLQQQNPSNRVYAEAARILRAKAAGTVPPAPTQ